MPRSTSASRPTATETTDHALPDDWFADDDELRPRSLVVTAGGVAYGVPVAQVREVVLPLLLRPVPGAPELLRGIVNVRGAIVTVLDLQALLSGARAVTAGSVVLIEHGARFVGLAVESVRDVRVLDDSAELSGQPIMPLDAVALCARQLLSAEERER